MADELGEDVLAFWLGEVDSAGFSTEASSARWWKKEPDFDAEIRDRFADDYGELIRGERAAWRESPRGLLASVIVLDQFSRNMFRGRPEMYAADELALSWAESAIDRGWDRELRGSARAFLYMPLMHSEALDPQERCVALFEAFRDEQPEGPARETLSRNARFAEQHRDIVARFGRFPHRNAILGRESTPEEEAFLSEPGSSF